MSKQKPTKKVRAKPAALQSAARQAAIKVCRRAPTTELNFERLAWRMSWMDHEGPWNWQALSADKLLELLAKLAGWEAMSWSQVLGEDPHTQHFVPLEALVTDAQRRLEELHLDDVDQLFRFRFDKTERLWGVRVGNVFYLLWWDADHEVCPAKAYTKPTGN